MSQEMADDFGMNKPKKRHTGLIVFFCLILGIAIGIGGSYYYFEIYSKQNSKKTTTTKKVETEEISVDSYLIKSLVDRMHYSLGTNSELLLYANEITKPSDLEGNYLNNLIVMEAKREILGTEGELTKENLNIALTTLFGSDSNVEIPTEDFGVCPLYKYNSKEEKFTEQDGECTFTTNLGIEKKLVKAVKSNEKIEIYEAVAFTDKDANKVYKKVDSSLKLSEEVEDIESDKFIIERDYEKVNQYKYTFTYDEDNGNYIFDSIEIVK